jgi:hypothetical protein
VRRRDGWTKLERKVYAETYAKRSVPSSPTMTDILVQATKAKVRKTL